jgi:translocation and assembly module TamB
MTPARRTLLLVCGGILVALLLAIAFRGQLLVQLLAFGMRRSLGLQTTIAQLDGNAIFGLDARGVSVRAAGAGPPWAFAAERVGARYSLAALLRGREAFLDSLELTVDGGLLDVDLSAPSAGPALAALPRLPRLAVRTSRLRVRGQGYALEADGVQGAVTRADRAGEQAVDLGAARLFLRHPALQERSASASIAGRYGPRRLAITAAQLDGRSVLERAALDLVGAPGEFDLHLALTLWQGSIAVDLQRRTGGTDVRWDARGVELQPQDLLVNPALVALRGRLSTEGELKLGGGGGAAPAGRVALDWEGARLAGRLVDHLALRGTAAAGQVRIESAAGRIGPNEITLLQLRLPAGLLFEGRWRPLLGAASGSFSASLGDLPGFFALWGVALADPAAVPAHRLTLAGSLEQGRIRIERGDLAAGRGRIALAGVALTLPREDQGWGETAFSGRATLELPDLGAVSALLPVPPLRGALAGEIDGDGTFARPAGRATLSGRGINVAGRLLGAVSLQARGTPQGVEIDSLQVRQGRSSFTAQGVRFAPAALATPDRSAFFDSLSGSFALDSTDLPGLAALAGLAADSLARTPATHRLTVAGTVRGTAVTFTAGSFAAAGGAVALRSASLTLPGDGANWRQDTVLAGDLSIDLPDLAPIAAIFRLPPLTGALSGRARIQGTAAAPTGSVDLSGRRITLRGHRVGDLLVTAGVQRRLVSIETLVLTRGADRLHGRGSFDLQTQTIQSAEAELSVADVAPYLAEFVREGLPVAGALRLGLRATGPPPGAPFALTAELSGGRIGDLLGVRGNATAHYSPGRLRIDAFELGGPGGLSVQGEAAAPVDFAADAVLGPGPLSLRAQASVPSLQDVSSLLPPAFALTGSLRAAVVAAGTWMSPEGRVEISGERLQLPPGTRFAPPGPATLSGALTWSAAEARAETLLLQSPALSCALSGTWSAPPSLPSLLAGRGAAGTGALALRTSFSVPDIGWLRESVADLRVLRGSAAGEIAVDGPAGAAALSGEVRVAGGALRYGDLPAIDSLAARATVAGRTVTLNEFAGNVGGSPFTLAGSLDFSRPSDPALDLRLRGANVLLYRDQDWRVRADSDLTLRGHLSALTLGGEVALTNGLYQKNVTVASLFSGGEKGRKRATAGLAGISFPEPPLRDMRFDVRITSREPFQIRTTVVRGGARPDLRLGGTGLLPILSGPIQFDDARVLLPSGALDISHGAVFYQEGDPDRPQLDFGARMQSQGYEITAQIGGTLETPEVILSSIPPLPREELLLFVLTGAPPGSVGPGGGSVSTAASPLAIYVGKNVLGQLLGGGPGGASGFPDRIEVQVGRELTRNGSVTVDARLLLKRGLLARGSTLYLTSEKDIYDQYNAGLKIVFTFK